MSIRRDLNDASVVKYASKGLLICLALFRVVSPTQLMTQWQQTAQRQIKPYKNSGTALDRSAKLQNNTQNLWVLPFLCNAPKLPFEPKRVTNNKIFLKHWVVANFSVRLKGIYSWRMILCFIHFLTVASAINYANHPVYCKLSPTPCKRVYVST